MVRNSIRALSSLEKEIHELVPKGTRIATAHGRMDGEKLEDTIIAFKKGEYDILIATTVIENGVNFLGANTIIIDEADEYGLASLHQLRGRVGRKTNRPIVHSSIAKTHSKMMQKSVSWLSPPIHIFELVLK